MRDKWSPWKRYANHVLVGFLIILIFICSLDFWNWQMFSLSFFGFPQWVWYGMILTFLLSIIYFLVVTYLWQEESF
mgnify:CR=1 FL=1